MNMNNSTSLAIPSLRGTLQIVERMLFLDMEFDAHYNASTHEEIIHFDKDPEAPTVEYPWLQYTVFALCVPTALMLVALCFYLSKRHEVHNRAKRDAERVAQYDHLRDKIKCKPWCHPDEQTRHFQRSVMYGSSVSPLDSAVTTTSTSTCCPDTPKDAQSFTKAHNGFYCVICLEAFSPGEPVYNSNNVDCQHQIHMKCMDHWVEHKNQCPVCHRPFVVLRPHEGDWKSVTTSITNKRLKPKGPIRSLVRSIRRSDAHLKEFDSVIEKSTVDDPSKIIEEPGNWNSSSLKQEAAVTEEEEDNSNDGIVAAGKEEGDVELGVPKATKAGTETGTA